MKKYRPIKLWIILLVLIIVGIVLGTFLMDGWKQVLMLIFTSVMIVVSVLSTTYYIQFQNDKIVIRHGLSSFGKSYRSNLKTRYILFNNIDSLSINHSSKYVIINLKDGNHIMFSFKDYLKTYQIADEFKIVNNKLNNK